MSDSVTKPGQRPTLRTIADMTGFAVATVSRALKDAPDISDATKLRVRKVAEEVGYRPNRAGVRLRTGKTNVIAIVLSAEDHVMNHTAQLIYSVSETLKGTPYHLIVMPFAPTDDPMTPIQYIVETGSADGVIFNQVCQDDPRANYLLKNNVPFATHGRTGMHGVHSSYDFDNAEYARIGVAALCARGRRNLLLVAPPVDQNYARSMIAGFNEAANAHGIAHHVATSIRSDSPVVEVERYFNAAMASDTPPDGFIFASSSSTMAAIAAAEQLGHVIGRDFDAVSKDALKFLTLFRKEIIVIEEDVSKAGRYLARSMIDMLEGREGAIREQLELPKMVPGAAAM